MQHMTNALGTPLTDGRGAKWAAQEEHPALTTSLTTAPVVGIYQRALHPLSSQQYQFYRTEGFGLAAFVF